MKKFIFGFLFLGLMPLYSIQTTEIREISLKKNAGKGDAIYLAACLKDPSLKRKEVKGSDQTAPVSFGELAGILLEQTETAGVWLYQLTHWSRYAFISAVERNWMVDEYSANRQVSGLELLAVIGKVQSDLKQKEITETEKKSGGKK